MGPSDILVNAPAETVWEILTGPSWAEATLPGTIDARHPTVVESLPPSRLAFRVPADGTASVRVEWTLEVLGGKTRVARGEDVCGGDGVLPDLVGILLAEVRRTWPLERLRELAEAQAPVGTHT